MINETYLRTITKTVLYRLLSSFFGVLTALAFGASSSQAGTLGLFILILGVVLYYLHDRVWANLNWFRSNEGKDSQWRSIAKTIAYRLLVLVCIYFISKYVMTMSAGQSALFAIVHLATNTVIYYLLERVFNKIKWGIVIKNDDNLATA